MKFWISLTSSLLAATALLSFAPVSGEGELYRDVVRLHVLAESDSDADQALKLKVRDAVLETVSDALSACCSADEAEAAICAMEDSILSAARTAIIENGGTCSVRVEFGEEAYPRREYDGFVFPAGVYRSCRVILGEGEGHNWWCVLFPGVCVRAAEADETLAAWLTPEEYRILTGSGGRWKVRLYTLELLSELTERWRPGAR